MTDSTSRTLDGDAPRASLSVDWLLERVTTTPSRLRLVAAAVAATLVACGIGGAAAAHSRQQAADSVATRTEPLLVQADRLNAALSDADATAATTFLTGGLEPAARRDRYLSDLRIASAELAALTSEVGSSDARRQVDAIAEELPVYSGLVETARANNRQGFPVGAAYLRQASGIMRGAILPAANRLYEVEALRLASGYRSGSSTSTVAAVGALAILALVVLLASQAYVARVSNRIFNVPLVVASVLVLAAAVWELASFTSEQDALSAARRDGSDAVEVLATTKVLLLRAERDEGLALAARGGGDAYAADFDAVTKAVGRPDGSGLLADVAGLERKPGEHVALTDLSRMLGRYVDVHGRIAALEQSAQFPQAVALAVGARAQEAPLSDRMSSSLERLIGSAQTRFEQDVADGRSALSGLFVGVALLLGAAVVLSLFGFGRRLREYR